MLNKTYWFVIYKIWVSRVTVKKHLLGPALIWNFISVDIVYLQK